MTKTEAMQNALDTICVAEIKNDVKYYMFNRTSGCYSLSLFTGPDIETAERVLEEFRHGLIDGTSMEISDLSGIFCVSLVWEWQ